MQWGPFAQVVVARRNGLPVLLSDVGQLVERERETAPQIKRSRVVVDAERPDRHGRDYKIRRLCPDGFHHPCRFWP